MVKITCIGELLVDMISEEKGSLKQIDGFVKRPGGAPANVAVAASRMGAEVKLIASVGDDEFGDFLLEKINEENIETENIRKRKEKTTLAFASLDEDADPHFSFYRGADQHIGNGQLENSRSDIIHIGSLPLTDKNSAENIFEMIESTEASVSFDPNLRPELMTEKYAERLEKMLKYTDILFAAKDELNFFGGLEKVRDKVDEVLITKGSEGAELYYKNEKIEAEPPEAEVIDTTGAGDAFTGTYLAHRDLENQKALKIAVEAASVSITEKGAMSALPYRQDIE